MMFRKQFTDVQDACALAHAIVDTVREPLIVLDQDLRVVAASRSFYLKFKVDPENTEGKLLYELGAGEWDIPKLRSLLGKIIPEHGAMEDYEVEHEYPDVGRRTMCLNARQVFYEVGAHTNILLSIEDITGRRTLDIGVLDHCYGLVAWEGPPPIHSDAAKKYSKARERAHRQFKCFHTFDQSRSKPSTAPFEEIKRYRGTDVEYFSLGDNVYKDLTPSRHLPSKTIWARYGTVVDKNNLATIVGVTPWSTEEIRLHFSHHESAAPDFIIDEAKQLLEIIPHDLCAYKQTSFL